MLARELQQTIIQNLASYADYSFDAIDPSALEILKHASPNSTRELRPMLKLLECYLQLTNQRLTALSFSHPKFSDLCEGFIGAVHDAHFFEASFNRRHTFASLFSRTIAAAKSTIPDSIGLTIILSSSGVTPEIRSYVMKFGKMTLDEEKLWLWRGWHASNRKGSTISLPLLPIYTRFGRSFTTIFYECCKSYFLTRKNNAINCMRPFCEFIGKYKGSLSVHKLQDPVFTAQFWREFFGYFVSTGYNNGRGKTIPHLVNSWRNQFIAFLTGYLMPAGLFAKPVGGLPSPEPRNLKGSNCHIKVTADGRQIKTKLLTDIPLRFSDQEAIELLFSQIKYDVSIFVEWAKWSVSNLQSRYERRLVLAKQGTPRIVQPRGDNSPGHKWLSDIRNPQHLQNAAATFQHHGYLTAKDARLNLLYPGNLREIANELALPVTNALLGHCILLVAAHPAITPAFLEDLQIFDKYDRPTGLIHTDGGYYLVGYKARRGAKLAEQKILLSAYDVEIVQHMIAVTQPLREYLRRHDDENWRYLLLSCQSAFAYPSRARLAINTSEPRRLADLADSLRNTCDLDLPTRSAICDRFSLASLRASAGLLVYLETHSMEKMAKALGHAHTDSNLLEHYLPGPIRAFFEERWVRIFQSGIIVEAMKDSDHILECADFKDIDELSEFLKNHALKIPRHLYDQDYQTPKIASPSQSKSESESESESEIIFGITPGILATLISLRDAVEQSTTRVNALAVYWAGIGRRLIDYLDSDLVTREDLKDYLRIARLEADPSLVKELIVA